MVPPRRADARLFEQLALGALATAFARPAASGGNLPDGSPHRVAILVKHRDPPLGVKCDDRGGTRMTNDRPLDGQALGQRGVLIANVDHSGEDTPSAYGDHYCCTI